MQNRIKKMVKNNLSKIPNESTLSNQTNSMPYNNPAQDPKQRRYKNSHKK